MHTFPPLAGFAGIAQVVGKCQLCQRPRTSNPNHFITLTSSRSSQRYFLALAVVKTASVLPPLPAQKKASAPKERRYSKNESW